MRRSLLLFWWVLGIAAAPAWAGNDPATKLSRGISNLTWGWFEVVNEMGNQADRHGLWIGIPSGLVRGAVSCTARMVTGAYETVTFLLPNGKKGYEPILRPASVFER